MIKYLVELVGTFIFLSVILNTGEAIPIATALAAVIFFGGKVSGGHFNPAVSTMMMLNESLSMSDFLPYVIAQVLGGVGALHLHKLTNAVSA